MLPAPSFASPGRGNDFAKFLKSHPLRPARSAYFAEPGPRRCLYCHLSKWFPSEWGDHDNNAHSLWRRFFKSVHHLRLYPWLVTTACRYTKNHASQINLWGVAEEKRLF